MEEKQVITVVNELLITYRRVSEIREKLGCFPDLEDTISSTVVNQIFTLIENINRKLLTIDEEISKLKPLGRIE